MKRIFFLPLIILMISCNDVILNPSEELTDVPVMEFVIDEYLYSKLLNGRLLDTEISIQLVFEEKLYEATLEASGAGSRYNPRWSYEIKLNEGSEIYGFSVFNLSSQNFDPTMLHTTLTSWYYSMLGMPTFKNTHVFLKINNEDKALLVMTEEVDEDYFERRNKDIYEVMKVEFGSKFTFEEGEFNPQFHFDKEIPDDDNYNNLIEFINAVDTSGVENLDESLGKFLNLENYIKYHAATSILNNDDSFTNNFFLIKENPVLPYEVIPWDFDKSFSKLNDVEYGGENAIIKKLFRNKSTFNWYKQEIIEQLTNYYTEENLFPIIDSTANYINAAYGIDKYLKNCYNLDEEILFLKRYISERRRKLIERLDYLTEDYFD
ncbi:MAG: CotH kinase family protein [Ignavibacteria bacterium]|jgi:spore coat protein H